MEEKMVSRRYWTLARRTKTRRRNGSMVNSKDLDNHV